MTVLPEPTYMRYYRDWYQKDTLGERLPKWNTLHQVICNHPVLNLLLCEEDLDLNQPLRHFLQGRLLSPHEGMTITDFCNGYMDFRLPENYRHPGSHDTQVIMSVGHENILEGLGQLALEEELLKGSNITRDDLGKVFPKVNYADLEVLLLGLLEKRPEYKLETYCFKERFLRLFLMARYQYRQILRQCISRKVIKLPKLLKRSAALLPVTGDLWALTIALMEQDDRLLKEQQNVFQQAFKQGKEPITDDFVLIFRLQVIYESRQRGSVGGYVEAYSRNQTLDLTNMRPPPSRLPYTLKIIGDAMPYARNLFGLKLDHMGITPDNLPLLVGHSNEFSEVSLQSLCLSENALGPRGLQILQFFLVKAHRLSLLDLSACDLRDEGARCLGELMMCMPVNALLLRENSISDEGGAAILRGMRRCNNLHTLDLSRNLMTDRWLLRFVKQMSEQLFLRAVDISENRVSATGQQLLRDCLAALNSSRCLSSKLQVFDTQQYPEEDAPSDFYTPAMVLGGPALSQGYPELGHTPEEQPKRPRGGPMPGSKSTVRRDWETRKSAFTRTTRENLHIARQQFFDERGPSPTDEDIAVEGQLKWRCMIGGGPEERLKSIGRSQARRSFFSTSQGTLMQETKL